MRITQHLPLLHIKRELETELSKRILRRYRDVSQFPGVIEQHLIWCHLLIFFLNIDAWKEKLENKRNFAN